ncbi:MAG: LD-carboxypeptidase [Methanothrix sp.]|jgi:muramoyltetrapeptide carboxypeptidase|uniref:S66 peptidase family protein n=1 Tax=Methanothrix sp. TaxID=90426 RepID=UPI0025FEBE3E|nr:LD-carboxypeptidase [Methanothrix sp.]MCK9405946.1 LD-carboxypeptidase [Methanothrix sp.]
MKLNKPKALAKGDTIGIVAPSTFSLDRMSYQRGIDRIKALGFRVEEGQTTKSKCGYMAGSDKVRANDIMEMFLNPDVKAIISLMGGSSADRLLDRLDYSIIAANPKIFTGMSDITHLHLAFLAQANMVSFHGLDLLFGFGGETGNRAIEYSINQFLQASTTALPLGNVAPYGKWEIWRDGIAEGRLVGGWLPALGYMANTRYWPEIDDIILFWEGIDLEIHEIDMILTSLRLSGVFERVRGMLIGKTPGCEEKEFAGLAPSIQDLVLDIAESYNFPIMANLDFGHEDENMILPEGILARVDTSQIGVSLLESAVND